VYDEGGIASRLLKWW